MKKILLKAFWGLSFFAAVCSGVFSENWVSELGNCWDSIEANPTLASRSYYERYNEIAENLRKGIPGIGEFSEEEKHDAWVSILKDFERYWSENCPRKFSFSRLRKYTTSEVVQIPFTVEVEPDEGNGAKTETRYKTEIKEKANYSVSVNSDFILKFYEMREIIQAGLRRARKANWTDIPRDWPVDSIYRDSSISESGESGKSDNEINGTLFVNYNGKSPATIVRISGTTFMDLNFDVKDRSGRSLLSSGRKLVSSSDVIFEGIESEKAELIDRAIENGDILYSPSELFVVYGNPAKITNYSRDWVNPLQAKQFQLNKIRFESAYETFHEEHHVVDEEEARVIASEMMVPVAGDGSIGSFEMAKTEVTQKLYKDVMRYNPSGFKNENRPVETVSWNDAIVFCNRLSEICGKTPVYSVNGTTDTAEWKYIPHAGNHLADDVEIGSGDGYRIPTEEEWKYAAHGGTAHEEFAYSGRDKDKVAEIAWYKKNAQKTKEVSAKEANSLGISDMTGNVWEWCFDVAEKDNYSKVAHGGSWSYDERYCKIDDLYIRNAHQRYDCLGIRLVSGSSGSVPNAKKVEATESVTSTEISASTVDAK